MTAAIVASVVDRHPLAGKRALQIRRGAPQRSVDAPSDEHAVVETLQARSRLVLDDEAVPEATVHRLKMALVTRVRQPVLCAVVLDEPVRLESPKHHPQLDLSAEQLDHDPRLVGGRRPARARLDPDDAGPVRRPVQDGSILYLE